jgi:hypothetical protein
VLARVGRITQNGYMRRPFDAQFRFNLYAADKARYEAIAAALGTDISEWMRTALRKAAEAAEADLIASGKMVPFVDKTSEGETDGKPKAKPRKPE